MLAKIGFKHNRQQSEHHPAPISRSQVKPANTSTTTVGFREISMSFMFLEVLGRCIQNVPNLPRWVDVSSMQQTTLVGPLVHSLHVASRKSVCFIHDINSHYLAPRVSTSQLYHLKRAVANISPHPPLGYVPVPFFFPFFVFLHKLHLQDPLMKSMISLSFLSGLSNITSFTQTQQDPRIKSIKSSGMRYCFIFV